MSLSETMSPENKRPLFTKPIEETKWSANNLEILRRLAADKLSTTKIAAMMTRMTGTTFTRNAIIGKARRLDIPLLSQAGNKVSPRPRVKAEAKPKRATPPPRPQAPKRAMTTVLSPPKFPSLENIVANPLKRDIYDMQRGECYWPVATEPEKGNILFCGHATGNVHVSWCAAHRKIGYQKPWERTR